MAAEVCKGQYPAFIGSEDSGAVNCSHGSCGPKDEWAIVPYVSSSFASTATGSASSELLSLSSNDTVLPKPVKHVKFEDEESDSDDLNTRSEEEYEDSGEESEGGTTKVSKAGSDISDSSYLSHTRVRPAPSLDELMRQRLLACARYMKLTTELQQGRFSSTGFVDAHLRERAKVEVVVAFTVHYVTHWGQELFLVGAMSELGGWDPSRAVKMVWTEDHIWSVQVTLPRTHNPIVYKYIVKDSNSQIRWEDGCNHELVIYPPEEGAVEVPKTIQDDDWSHGMA